MSSLLADPDAGKAPVDALIDQREQLFNGREVGPANLVQISEPRIRTLHGIMYDLDPDKLRGSEYTRGVRDGLKPFFEQTVQAWLTRDPVLTDAEVRISGTGLHLLIWLDSPVVFTSDGDRDRWAGIVEVIQAVLPIDPNQPGITALTRKVGTTNSKNGAPVELLKAGRPILVAAVERLYEQMSDAPFRTVMSIVMDGDRISPCPICGEAGSMLVALNQAGHCYNCGTIKLHQLYDVFLAPRASNRKEAARDEQA